ncbi:hypothetical protein PPTG_21316, partial [Phytophthora nicotianae INRA-310]
MTTPDVAPATATTASQPFDDLVDKVESGYAAMPTTPKTATSFSTSKPQGLQRFAVQSVHLRECFAEFLGTFVMIVFGMGVNNQ